MASKKVHTTYIVHLTGTDRYDANQDCYYRTEAEANQKAADLREWFKNVPSQQVNISSHEWVNN